ncbi:LysR substrate binding domain protein [compost metagenome]
MLELAGPQGERETVRLQARVLASQVLALQAMAEAGWGIQVAVAEDARQAMAHGTLVPVLPGWTLGPVPVFAVTPTRDELPAKVRHTLAALQAHFATHPGGSRVRD